MRHTKDNALVFRYYRVNSSPTQCAEQPSAEFSPHNLYLLDCRSVPAMTLFVLSMTFFVIPDLIGDLDVYVFEFSLASEVMADEVLSVYGVVTHVELHDLRNRLFITQLHLVKSHTFSDEIFELIR